MDGLIAYTGTMPAKRKGARGRFEMVLSPTDERILTALETKTGLNRTAAVRLSVRESAERRGIDLSEVKEEETE